MPIPEMIDTTQYKWLNIVCWDRRGAVMTRERVWGFYAYRWSYMSNAHELEDDEKELINVLINEFGPIIPVVETRGTMGNWIYGDPIERV
jgi:hypothetical protein